MPAFALSVEHGLMYGRPPVFILNPANSFHMPLGSLGSMRGGEGGVAPP